MLQQPADYSLVTATPSQSLMGGFKAGYGIGDAFKRNNEEAALKEQGAERNARLESAMNKAFSPGATSRDIAEFVMLADPKKAQILKDQMGQLGGDQRQSLAGTYGSIYSALSQKNYKVAKQLLNEMAEAVKNSGDTGKANMFNSLAASIDVDPFYAESKALEILSSSDEGLKVLDTVLEQRKTMQKAGAEESGVSPEVYQSIKNGAIRPDGSFDPVKGYQILSENGVSQKQQDSIIKSINAGYPASQRASQEVIDMLETPPGKKQAESRQELSQEVFTKIPNFERMERLLGSGVFDEFENGKVLTGPFAQKRLWLAKVANASGLDWLGTEADVSRTEEYLASAVQATANIVKQFGAGTGISDADREFAAKAAGGDISMSREALQSIVNAGKMAIVNKTIAHNASVAKVARNTPGQTGKAYFDMQAFTEDEFSPEMAKLMKEAGAFDMGVKVLSEEEGDRIRAMIDNMPAAESSPVEQEVPMITTQEAYDALPPGTLYKEDDGETYRKP